MGSWGGGGLSRVPCAAVLPFPPVPQSSPATHRVAGIVDRVSEPHISAIRIPRPGSPGPPESCSPGSFGSLPRVSRICWDRPDPADRPEPRVSPGVPPLDGSPLPSPGEQVLQHGHHPQDCPSRDRPHHAGQRSNVTGRAGGSPGPQSELFGCRGVGVGTGFRPDRPGLRLAHFRTPARGVDWRLGRPAGSPRKAATPSCSASVGRTGRLKAQLRS